MKPSLYNALFSSGFSLGRILAGTALVWSVASCSFRDEAYTFDSDHVGPIARDARFSGIADLFPDDSVVPDSVELQLGFSYYNYDVYRSADSLLLVVSPHKDSVDRVGSIRIVNGLYTTKDGLGPGSTFGEFSTQYELGKVRPGAFLIGVEVKNENFQLLIPRSELPESLQMTAAPVDLVQIPDEAVIRFVTVSW